MKMSKLFRQFNQLLIVWDVQSFETGQPGYAWWQFFQIVTRNVESSQIFQISNIAGNLLNSIIVQIQSLHSKMWNKVIKGLKVRFGPWTRKSSTTFDF